MKKIALYLLMAAFLLSALVSCGSNSPTSNNSATATPTFTATPTANVTIIANFGGSTSPGEMAVDSQNNVYVALSGSVSIGKISSSGVTSTISTTTAPFSLGLDNAGDIFFTAASNAAGVTELLYGGGQSTFAQAGNYAVAVNNAGTTLYVASGTYTSTVITPWTTTAQTAIAIGGLGNPAFGTINGMTFDSQGNLFFADTISYHEIGEITATSLASGSPTPVLVAGPNAYGAGWTDGAGASALFYNPYGIAADSSGNVYVADSGNGAIRKISGGTGNWTVSTLVAPSHSPAFTYTIGTPKGVAVDSNGNVYFDDAVSGNVFRYQP